MLSDFGQNLWKQLSNLNVWWPHFLFIDEKRKKKEKSLFCKCFQTLSSRFLEFWLQLLRQIVKFYFESPEKHFEGNLTFENELTIFPDLEQKLNDFGLIFWHGYVNFI